jgi:hypothetical protein
MAALLHDLESGTAAASNLFWNTYNSRPLPTIRNDNTSRPDLPEQFRRYYV